MTGSFTLPHRLDMQPAHCNRSAQAENSLTLLGVILADRCVHYLPGTKDPSSGLPAGW